MKTFVGPGDSEASVIEEAKNSGMGGIQGGHREGILVGLRHFVTNSVCDFHGPLILAKTIMQFCWLHCTFQHMLW